MLNVCSTVKIICKNRIEAFSEEQKSGYEYIASSITLSFFILMDKYTKHQHCIEVSKSTK